MPSFKNEVEQRALNAYFRRAGAGAAQPTAPEIVKQDGKEYVVLYNTNGQLAAYEIKADGSLRYSEVVIKGYE